MPLKQFTDEEWKIFNELKETSKNIYVDDARIIWPNFSGRETAYNKEGDRNFCVRLDSDKLLDSAMSSGYNVKYRAEGEDSIPFLKINVVFGDNRYPCQVFMKSRGKVTELKEDTVSLVDSSDILKANVIIQPKPWVINKDRYGIAARLKALYLTVSEDKYAEEFFDEENEDEMIPFD